MHNRPKINIPFAWSDYLAFALSYGMLIYLWILVVTVYPKLPEIIPTHFTINGIPDDFGCKSTIIFLPIIATILVVAISILSKFPYIFNYPVKITAENAERQYTMAIRMLRFLKVVLAYVFTFLTKNSIEVAMSKRATLSEWLLPIAVILIFFPIVFFLRESLRRR